MAGKRYFHWHAHCRNHFWGVQNKEHFQTSRFWTNWQAVATSKQNLGLRKVKARTLTFSYFCLSRFVVAWLEENFRRTWWWGTWRGASKFRSACWSGSFRLEAFSSWLSQGAKRNFNEFLRCLKTTHLLLLVLLLRRFPPKVDLTFRLSPMLTEKKNFKHFAQKNPYFRTTLSLSTSKRLQEWKRRWLPSRTLTSTRRSWSLNALPSNFRTQFQQTWWSEQKATVSKALCAFLDITRKSIPTTLTLYSAPSLITLKLSLTLAVAHGWHILAGNVSTAFLHALLTEEVLVIPPVELYIPAVEFFGNFAKPCMDLINSPHACGSSTLQVLPRHLGLNDWNVIRTCTYNLSKVATFTCCATLTTCWFSVTRKLLNSCSPNFQNSCAWDRKVYLTQVLRLVFLDVASPIVKSPLRCQRRLLTVAKCLSNLTCWNVGMLLLQELMYFESWSILKNFFKFSRRS